MERIYELFERDRLYARDLNVTILAGDQTTFKMLCWAFCESLKLQNSEFLRWMFPIKGGFYNYKTGLVDTLKLLLGGTGMEAFLDDCGLSA